MSKGQWGYIAGLLLVLVVSIVLSLILRSIGMELNLFLIIPWTFPLIVISAGALAFLGYKFTSDGKVNVARKCFNLSVILTFFGILVIEMVVFGAFITKVPISYQPCEKEENPVNIASCIMTGYKPPEEYMGWQWASFWIFFIILPFAFIFSIVWGFLADVRILPKPVMMVISFVLATYATRQVFGAFLLDIAAYGVWGVVGIFIPLLLSFMVKRVFDTFLGSAKQAAETLYGMIGAHLYASVEDIRTQLERIENALRNLSIDRDTLNSMKSLLELMSSKIAELEKAVKESKELSITTKSDLLSQIEMLRRMIEADKRGVEERIKRTPPPGMYV